jgi:hypothetical protein
LYGSCVTGTTGVETGMSALHDAAGRILADAARTVWHRYTPRLRRSQLRAGRASDGASAVPKRCGQRGAAMRRRRVRPRRAHRNESRLRQLLWPAKLSRKAARCGAAARTNGHGATSQSPGRCAAARQLGRPAAGAGLCPRTVGAQRVRGRAGGAQHSAPLRAGCGRCGVGVGAHDARSPTRPVAAHRRAPRAPRASCRSWRVLRRTQRRCCVQKHRRRGGPCCRSAVPLTLRRSATASGGGRGYKRSLPFCRTP